MCIDEEGTEVVESKLHRKELMEPESEANETRNMRGAFNIIRRWEVKADNLIRCKNA